MDFNENQTVQGLKVQMQLQTALNEKTKTKKHLNWRKKERRGHLGWRGVSKLSANVFLKVNN